MRRLIALAAAMLVTVSPAAPAQEADAGYAERGPRFLIAASPTPVRVDVAKTPTLRRRISLDLRGVPLTEALRVVSEKSGVQLAFSNTMLPADRAVEFRADNITVAAALTELLLDAQVDILFSRDGRGVLVRRQAGVAQTGTIVGRVTDAKTGEKVAGAELFLEGTRWRATTDTSGRYRLAEVDTGSYTLTVRRFGYARQSRAVTVVAGQEDTVHMVLEPVVTRLNELVTTATGSRRRMEIANAVTVLRADSLVQTQPIKNVTDLLETRVPGLTTLPTTGAPGDPTRLRLRGSSSILRSNDPIVIVDGVRIYAEQSDASSGSLAWTGSETVKTGIGTSYTMHPVPAPSPLDRIDPNSIETLEVLNGPSAAALYGADAANGVIVITTKRGRPGPARWDAALTHGRSVMPGRFPDVHFSFARSLNQSGENCSLLGDDRDPTCIVDSVIAYQVLNDPQLTVLGQGHSSGASATVSGGRPDILYAITGSYANEVGLLTLPQRDADWFRDVFGRAPEDWMERPHRLTQWGLSSKFTFKPAASAGLALTMSLNGVEQRRASLEQQLAPLRRTYVDTKNDVIYGKSTAGSSFQQRPNLVPDFYRKTTNRALALKTGVNLNWQPLERFKVLANAGINADLRRDESLVPPGLRVGAADSGGFHATGQGTATIGTLDVGAAYLMPLGWGFKFDAVAGFNYTTHSKATLYRDALRETTAKASESSAEMTSYGWYVAPRLGSQRLFFDLGFRLDGGSNYGSRAGGFSGLKLPKLGFAWLISDEPFFPLKHSSVLSMLRLRASYGQAGVQPGPTDRLRLFARGGGVAIITTVGNTQLRPERSSEIEGGFDADLLDDRLSVGLTAYRKTKLDAHLMVSVAPSVAVGGTSSLLLNIGVVRNTGIEFTLSTNVLRGERVNWSTQLNVTQNRNVVVSLAAENEAFGIGGDKCKDSSHQCVVVGYPLFGHWAPPLRGYADANGDGILQSGEVLFSDSLAYLGAGEPDYIADLHTTIGLFRGTLAMTGSFNYQNGFAQAQSAVMGGPLDRASQDPSAPLAQQALIRSKHRAGLIQTVSLLRFHSVAVNWQLPRAAVRWVGAQRGSLAVQGTNLALVTNYRGKDPLVNSLGTGNAVLDAGGLPTPREWRVALNFSY